MEHPPTVQGLANQGIELAVAAQCVARPAHQQIDSERRSHPPQQFRRSVKRVAFKRFDDEQIDIRTRSRSPVRVRSKKDNTLRAALRREAIAEFDNLIEVDHVFYYTDPRRRCAGWSTADASIDLGTEPERIVSTR